MQDRALKLWNPHKGTLVKTYNGEEGAGRAQQRVCAQCSLLTCRACAGHGYDVRDVAVSSDNSKRACSLS